MTSEVKNDEATPQELFFRISGTFEQGVFQGKILDIGCGIEDNAIYIVTYADNVPKAIEVARKKAEKANVNIQFEVVDFIKDLSTTDLKKNFYDIILNAAVFHVFFPMKIVNVI